MGQGGRVRCVAGEEGRVEGSLQTWGGKLSTQVPAGTGGHGRVTYPIGIVPGLVETSGSMLQVDLVRMWAWLRHGGRRGRGARGTPCGGQHQRSQHHRRSCKDVLAQAASRRSTWLWSVTLSRTPNQQHRCHARSCQRHRHSHRQPQGGPRSYLHRSLLFATTCLERGRIQILVFLIYQFPSQ